VVAAIGSRLEHGEAEHERFWNPVEDDSEHDRERRTGGLVATRRFPTRAPKPVDERVSKEEDTRSREEAERHAAVADGGLERLLYELEGDGADEHPRTEGHDHPEQASADRKRERDDAA